MKLLAVETSTEACSAALLVDNEIIDRYQFAPRKHSLLILEMVDSLLVEAELTAHELDVLAFGQGPGSFMGVRIAAGIVQGIAFAQDKPVVPVSTLAAIARVAMDLSHMKQVMVAIDARMNEVYWGVYSQLDNGELELHGQECVILPEQVSIPEQGEWVAAGTGWGAYADIMKKRAGNRLIITLEECLPTARAIAVLAATEYRYRGGVMPSEAVPVYLRDNVATKPFASQ